MSRHLRSLVLSGKSAASGRLLTMTVIAGGCMMGGLAPEPCGALDSATVALKAPGSGSGIVCPEAQPAPGTPEPAYRDDIFFDEGASSCGGSSTVDGYFGIYFAPIEPYLPSEYTIGPDVMCGLSYSSGVAASCQDTGDITSQNLVGTDCTNTFRWFGARMFATNRPQVSREVDGSDVVQRINLFPNSRKVLTYKRAIGSGAGDTFAGTNGTTSMGEMYDADPGSTVHNVFKIRDRRGYVSWYFAKDPTTVTRGSSAVEPHISGQLWKIAYDTGNSDETTWPTMYVGEDKPGTTGWNTLANAYRGFEVCTASGTTILQPRVKTMYNSAGRKFTYTYSGDSVSSVKKEYWTGSAWATSSEATFDYYDSGDTNGPTGMLRLIQTTEAMSDSAVKQYRYQYFRYDSQGHMTLQMASEGIRQAVFGATSSISYTSLSAVRDYLKNRDVDLLKPYSSAVVTYSGDKVATIIANGMCGCTGGGPSGQYTYTYQLPSDYSASTNGVDDSDGDYDCNGAWFSATQSKSARRTKVQNPDGTYDVTYYDDTAQVLGLVHCAVDPDGGTHNTSAQTIWATLYERDADTRIVKVYTPEMVTSYSHSTGKFTVYSGTTPPGTMTEYVYSTNTFLTGKVVTEVRVNTKTSATATAPVSVTTYETSGSDWYMDIGGANGVRIAKPIVKSSKVYKNEVTSGSGTDETDYDTTTYAYTFWGSGSIPWAFKSVQTTHPRSLTGENGSNTAVSTFAYLDQKSGKTVFSKNADGRVDFYKYDSDTGRVLDTVMDVDDSVSDAVTASSGILTLPAYDTLNPTKLFRLRTTYKYDSRSRLISVTTPTSSVSNPTRTTFTYYTRLGDHQAVVLSGPKVTGTSGSETYTGPVDYSVVNLAGRSTVQGTLTLSGSGNTGTSIASWISTSATSPISAVGGSATLARFSESQYDLTGNRLNKSLLYTSWSGTPVTEDTEYRYDGMGRVVGVKDPTGTIRRSTFDARGRGLCQWIGTNDYSQAGEKFSTAPTDDMTKTSLVEYATNTPSSGSYLLGTSRVFKQHQDAVGDWTGTANAADRRTVELIYDYRNRVVVQKAQVSPHSVTKYDFRGRAIALGSFKSTSSPGVSTDPTSVSTDRLSLSETFYDGRGQVYKSTQHEINQSTGASASTLDTLMWYDADRQTIKSIGPGGLTKYAYDRLDRQIRSYSLASISDSAYADADDVTGDVVLEESLTAYEYTTGNVLMSASFARHHDKDATITGPLDNNDAGDNDNFKITGADLKRSGAVIARAQITAIWYDDFNRSTDTVQYGTYALNDSGGNTVFTRTGLAVPSRSETALLTTTAYDKDGTVLTTTDPKNITTKTLYDKAGRRTATIANFINSVPDNASTKDDDHFVRYAYQNGLLQYMWVDVAGNDTTGTPPTVFSGSDTDDQVTQYLYGTTKGTPGSGTAPASRIATGDLLREAVYPPQTGSQAAADRTVFTAYNALAEQVWTRDQNGTVLETTYDTAGRQTARTATNLGTNIDGTVRRVETSYTPRGQIEAVVQYDSTSAGTALNGIKYTYHNWGSISSLEQDRDSAVGGSGASALAVSWGTANSAPSGGRPRVQTTSITLPGSYTVTYGFGSSTSIDNLVGRVADIDFPESGTEGVQYAYMGQSMVVGTTLTGPARRSRLYNSSNLYADLDLYNRVLFNRWTNSSNAADVYRIELGYDRNSNITRILDPLEKVAGTRRYDTDYTMDALNRVTKADRGTLSSNVITGSARLTQDWTLSQTGNWSSSTIDLNGAGGAEFTDTRTHNNVNELLARSGTVSGTAAHDKAGQMTDDGTRYTYVYDAFGRLVTVKNRSTTTTIAEYVYDGAGQRIGWHYDVNASGGGPDASDPWYWFIQDDRWRTVATYRVAGGAGSGTTSFRHASATTDANPKERFVFHAAGPDGSGGSSYIDSMMLARRDLNTAWGSAADSDAEAWHYLLTNWRNDTVRVESRFGGLIAGYRYNAYGSRTNTLASDFNQDGFEDFFDYDDFYACFEDSTCPSGITADWNADGVTDYFDEEAFLACFDGDVAKGGTLRHLYAGYGADPIFDALDATTSEIHSTYHVRNRAYSTDLGRWTKRDPLGYVDQLGLLEYCKSAPVVLGDPLGLDPSILDKLRDLWRWMRGQKICGPDVTSWLLNQLNVNGNSDIVTLSQLADQPKLLWLTVVPMVCDAYTGAACTVKFGKMVYPFGPWDFKTNQSFTKGVCPSNCPNSVTLCGKCVHWDVPGNIHYGYLARKMRVAPVYYQYIPGFFDKSGCWPLDDPRDRKAVDAGAELSDLGILTHASLCNLVRRDIEKLNLGEQKILKQCAPCRSQKW